MREVLATQFGMGVAAVAFAALPPPVSDEVRRHAMRRLAGGVRAAATLPRALRPEPRRWLGRMSARLHRLDGAEATVRRGGEDLVLAGLLILAARGDDERFGRAAGRAVWGADAAQGCGSGIDRPS